MCFIHQQHQSAWFPVLLLNVQSHLTDARLCGSQPYLLAVLSYPTDASLRDGLVLRILLQQPYLLAVLSYLTDASLRDSLVLRVLLQQPYLLAVLVHVVLHNRRQPHDAVPQLLALSSHQPLLFFFLKHTHTQKAPQIKDWHMHQNFAYQMLSVRAATLLTLRMTEVIMISLNAFDCSVFLYIFSH